MSPTTIDLDDEACRRVMERFGFRTKRDAVNFALRHLVSAMSLEEALAMWDGRGDLGEVRQRRVAGR